MYKCYRCEYGGRWMIVFARNKDEATRAASVYEFAAPMAQITTFPATKESINGYLIQKSKSDWLFGIAPNMA